MKIIGGHYGVKGSVFIRKDSSLAIDGAEQVYYTPNEITSVYSSTESDRKFGVIGFLLGAIIFSSLLFFLIGPLGVFIALVLSVVGSFYTVKRHQVELTFVDNKSVKVECSAGDAKRLTRLSAVK